MCAGLIILFVWCINHPGYIWLSQHTFYPNFSKYFLSSWKAWGNTCCVLGIVLVLYLARWGGMGGSGSLWHLKPFPSGTATSPITAEPPLQIHPLVPINSLLTDQLLFQTLGNGQDWYLLLGPANAAQLRASPCCKRRAGNFIWEFRVHAHPKAWGLRCLKKFFLSSMGCFLSCLFRTLALLELTFLKCLSELSGTPSSARSPSSGLKCL